MNPVVKITNREKKIHREVQKSSTQDVIILIYYTIMQAKSRTKRNYYTFALQKYTVAAAAAITSPGTGELAGNKVEKKVRKYEIKS